MVGGETRPRDWYARMLRTENFDFSESSPIVYVTGTRFSVTI